MSCQYKKKLSNDPRSQSCYQGHRLSCLANLKTKNSNDSIRYASSAFQISHARHQQFAAVLKHTGFLCSANLPASCELKAGLRAKLHMQFACNLEDIPQNPSIICLKGILAGTLPCHNQFLKGWKKWLWYGQVWHFQHPKYPKILI